MASHKIPSENILKLRELTEKICNRPLNDEHYVILKELKDIIDDGKEEVSNLKTTTSKIKCYEKMCVKITNILNNVKL
jgi:hypothetical protein